MFLRIIITLSFYLTTALVLNNAFAAEVAGATTTMTEDGRQIPDSKSLDTNMTPRDDGFVGPRSDGEGFVGPEETDQGRQPASVDEEDEDFYDEDENDLQEDDWQQEDDLLAPPSPTRNGI